MKIDWLVDEVNGDWGAGFRSVRASNRYRAIIPASELRGMGHDVNLLPMADWRAPASGTSPAEVVVVSKQFGWLDPDGYAQVAAQLRSNLIAVAERGARVVVDYCDDHFEHRVVGSHWQALASIAHTCVAASPALAEMVQHHVGRSLVVVGDPVASPRAEPRVFKRRSLVSGLVQSWASGGQAVQRLRLVWFGTPANFAPLLDWMRQLAPLGRQQPWLLSVVTNPSASIEQALTAFNDAQGGHARAELVPWSEPAQWDTVASSDVVLIPVNTGKAAKLAKSSNRLLDAMNMGRFVIASPIPAYTPFSAYASLSDDPFHELEAYLQDPKHTLQRITAGQLAALDAGLPAVIAKQWLRAFDGGPAAHAVHSTAHPPQSATAPLVRLNLGCGDKILPGYVNVDVAEARAGKSPDVLCDLRQLTPFPDSHADEILAVHVVEHFWRWEITEVLKEWVRVLKPGGRMVLECPNLKAACEAFLADPEAGSRPDASGQRTMWVFYGDPKWKDPLMVHRWGYTPASLAALMTSAGLENARQEPAQFKLREPRDMRVVAEKPLSRSPDASSAPPR